MAHEYGSVSRGLRAVSALIFLCALFLFAGCGSGGGGDGSGGGESKDPTYTITGKVTLSGAGGLGGVSVSLAGDGACNAVTDANGAYTFLKVPNGSYTITPSLEGYAFTPASLPISVNGADMTSDFIAAPSGSPQAALYESLSLAGTQADFLVQANEEGAKGYRFISLFSDETEAYSIYVKDHVQDAAFSYAALADAATTSGFLTQANMQGAMGFRFVMEIPFADDGLAYAIYGRDTSRPTTYSYEGLAPAVTADAFRVQANAEGARGFRYLADSVTLTNNDTDVRSIYVKDNWGDAAFTYEVMAASDTPDDFIAQVNAEGARGYRYLLDIFLQGEAVQQSVYIKDDSQGSTFTYETLAPTVTAGEFITQAVGEGVKGCRYLGTRLFSQETFLLPVYVDLSSCQGILLQVQQNTGW